MDIKKMEYFIAAAEEGTFTKAATRCYISQTAISQQIAGLEKELGVMLFDRTNYRPQLTPAGTLFYEQCTKLLEQFQNAVEEVKQLAEGSKKELNIGITGSHERLMLTKVLKSYVSAYPDIAINLIEHSVNDCISLLKDGTLDLLFAVSDDLRNEQNLKVEQLFVRKLAVLVPPDHKFATRKEVRGSELKEESFVVLEPEQSKSLFHSFISACRKDGYEPRIAQIVNSPYDILMMVSIGRGVAIASEEIRMDESLVHSVRLIESAHQSEYCLARLKHNTAKEITDFIEIATRECEKE